MQAFLQLGGRQIVLQISPGKYQIILAAGAAKTVRHVLQRDARCSVSRAGIRSIQFSSLFPRNLHMWVEG